MIDNLALGRRLLMAAALLALAGCQTTSSADGYPFGPKEYDRSRVTVTLVGHRSLSTLRSAAKERHAIVEGERQLMGWSVLSADRAGCEVHILDPLVSWKAEWLGHEVAHCFFGRWHQ